MADKQAIILVPGLFGFTQIGQISYFADVKDLLALSGEIRLEDIFEMSTLPTGPLWRRVATLHKAVKERIDHGYSKVHLIGHSTGGVDVRLLVNAAYMWPGGPSGDERKAFLKNIGRVISISAPHKGTPIAARLTGAMENVVPILFLLTVLAKVRAEEGARVGLLDGLFLTLTSVQKWAMPRSRIRVMGTERGVADALNRYLSDIVEDHPLVQELTPFAMAELNAKIRDGEQVPVLNFITVAPPQSLSALLTLDHLLTPVQRLIYLLSHALTSLRSDEFGPFPKGPWIDDVVPPALRDFKSTAQDGVVPSASQTLEGNPNHSVAGLIYGDHLDVVGHYRGRYGSETVFDSGADFDDARMRRLWLGTIAPLLRVSAAQIGAGTGAQWTQNAPASAE